MSITSNISSLSSPQLIGIAKNQLKGKTDLVKQTILTKTDQLKNQAKELAKKRINVEIEYNQKLTKLQEDYKLGYVTEEEKNQKYQQFQDQKSKELKLIDEEIQKTKDDIINSSNDILKQIKEQKKKINNLINNNKKYSNKNQRKADISRNVQVLKNTSKDKIASVVLLLLTNLAISIIKKNNKLQELVDKTNEIIDSANTIEKINQARVLRNNALAIINNQENKTTKLRNAIRTIQRIIGILTVVITIIQAILRLPFPFLVGIKIRLQPILQKILEILGSLSIGLSIMTSILNDIIVYLENLKSQLHNIDALIDAKTINPLLNVEEFLQSIRSSSSNLGTYKGFKFAIREEIGPNATVIKGYKRHYAVAIDTNNVEVLKSDLSFTQDPQDLIDTLKVIIDRENLIA